MPSVVDCTPMRKCTGSSVLLPIFNDSRSAIVHATTVNARRMALKRMEEVSASQIMLKIYLQYSLIGVTKCLTGFPRRAFRSPQR